MTILKKEQGKQALYLQLCDIYRKKIADGVYKVGDRIESEKEIQELYGVSRITVRQAIDALEKEGVLIKKRGLGTFVVGSRKIAGDLFQKQSFEEIVRNSAAEPVIAATSIDITIPPEDIRNIMHMGISESCMIYKKVGQVNEVRIAYIVTYVPITTDVQDEEELIAYIGRDEFQHPYRTENRIMAVLPEKEIYQSLHIDSGQPIFFHRSEIYDQNDILMGVVDTYYRGDMFSYTAQL